CCCGSSASRPGGWRWSSIPPWAPPWAARGCSSISSRPSPGIRQPRCRTLLPELARGVPPPAHLSPAAARAADVGVLPCPRADGNESAIQYAGSGQCRLDSQQKRVATTLKFEWREHGGPTVTPPNRRRFGNPLLKAIFGEARIDYAPEGVSCAKPQLSFRSSGIAAGIMQSEFAALFPLVAAVPDVPAINPAKDRRHRPGID